MTADQLASSATDSEQQRVAAVERYDITEQPPEADLVALARLAARIAGVGNGTVNIIDATRQHQVATAGFEPATGPRETAICNVAITLDEPLYEPDISQDPRFAGNPWVTGELGCVRFYNASQLRTPDGHVIGTLCVFDERPHQLEAEQRRALDDLAEQIVQWLELRRQHAALASTVGELERSNQDLSAFAGRIAHDLRNPLAALTGFLTLADRRFGDELSDRLRMILGTSLETANRMRDLVDGLLAFATVGGEPMFAEVDLDQLAAAVRSDVSGAVEAAGARVDVRPLPTIVTDPTLVRVLLQNLVANALKFTREDVPPLVVVAGGAETGGGWLLSVSDNGRGVPDEEKTRIFAPFGRASNATGVAGSGIGLATCARIAERLGGRLEVADTPGGGATFTLRVAG